MLMVIDVAKRIKDAPSGGPHLVNLGHGATPDADAACVEIPLKAVKALGLIHHAFDGWRVAEKPGRAGCGTIGACLKHHDTVADLGVRKLYVSGKDIHRRAKRPRYSYRLGRAAVGVRDSNRVIAFKDLSKISRGSGEMVQSARADQK